MIEAECASRRILEIERQRAAAALGDLMPLRRFRVAAIDPQDVGAHVGQKHPAEWTGTDAGKFHDTHAAQWPLPIHADPPGASRCRLSRSSDAESTCRRLPASSPSRRNAFASSP
jgi:hypothetical protein